MPSTPFDDSDTGHSEVSLHRQQHFIIPVGTPLADTILFRSVEDDRKKDTDHHQAIGRIEVDLLLGGHSCVGRMVRWRRRRKAYMFAATGLVHGGNGSVTRTESPTRTKVGLATIQQGGCGLHSRAGRSTDMLDFGRATGSTQHVAHQVTFPPVEGTQWYLVMKIIGVARVQGILHDGVLIVSGRLGALVIDEIRRTIRWLFPPMECPVPEHGVLVTQELLFSGNFGVL